MIIVTGELCSNGYLTNTNTNRSTATSTNMNIDSYLPRGTTAGTPTGDTVITVMVELCS